MESFHFNFREVSRKMQGPKSRDIIQLKMNTYLRIEFKFAFK